MNQKNQNLRTALEWKKIYVQSLENQKKMNINRFKIIVVALCLIGSALSSLAQKTNSIQEWVDKYKKSPPETNELAQWLQEKPQWYPQAWDEVRKSTTPQAMKVDMARFIILSDRSPSELKWASEEWVKASWDPKDMSEGVYLCQKLGQQNVSIIPCVDRILNEEKFKIKMSGGSSAIGKDYALMFVLMSVPEVQWNRYLGDRLWLGKDSEENQLALLNAMFYAVSIRDDAIISRIAEDPKRSEKVRQRALYWLNEIDDMENHASDNYVQNFVNHEMNFKWPQKEEALREARRQSMKQVSPVALKSLQNLTYLIRVKALERWNKKVEKEHPSNDEDNSD